MITIPEIIGNIRSLLGEGPVWDVARGHVLWLDIQGRWLHRVTLSDDTVTTWPLPCRIGSLAPPPMQWQPPRTVAGDTYLCCGDEGLAWLSLERDGVRLAPIIHPERHLPGNRFNDGKPGPDGRYWAGTMDDAEEQASGSLYAFAPDGSFEQIDAGYRVTNGPAFSPDGRKVYHTDSALQVIYAFDRQCDGRLANKRPFVTFASGEGYPDGMTTDQDGNLWVAMWDGNCVEKISPDGKRIDRIEMPVPRCTSCCFADEDDTVLYVTTARIGLPGNDPLCGALFRVLL